jgi:4-amino-4-deoxy-L-arabinose transferase-like glycosyltransferase
MAHSPSVQAGRPPSLYPTLTHSTALSRLVLAALLLFLVGFWTLPPMDRDETRFAQASRQMLETGDFVDIRFQAEARHKKPVGIYWLQAAAVRLAEGLGFADARQTIWVYRLPSLIGALAAVLLTYWTGLALTTRISAYFSALLFAATILIGVEARLAKTDAVLTAAIVAAMGAMARIYLQAREGEFGPKADGTTAAIFWSALALAILVKGPLAPMVVGLAALALFLGDRRAAWLKGLYPIPGLLWLTLLIAPWLIAIGLRSQGAFFSEALGHDFAGKVTAAQEGHFAPPGVYAAAFLVTGWPLSAFLLLALPFAFAHRRDANMAFLIAWIVPSWLVFEAVPTKLPHYVLPLYPALALVVGVTFSAGRLDASRGFWPVALAVLPLVGFAAPVAAALWFWHFDLTIGPLWLLLGLAPGLIGLCAAWLAWRQQMIIAIPVAVVAAVALSAFAYAFVLARPQFDAFTLSPRLVEAAQAALRDRPECREPHYASTGFAEPSLVFLTRSDLLITNPSGAAAFLQPGGCRVAFVDMANKPPFDELLGTGAAAHRASIVQGININGGKRLDIGVYVGQ